MRKEEEDSVSAMAISANGHRGPATSLRGVTVAEVTRDMANPCSLGRVDVMPRAVQTADRFHVMQLLYEGAGRDEVRQRPRANARVPTPALLRE